MALRRSDKHSSPREDHSGVKLQQVGKLAHQAAHVLRQLVTGGGGLRCGRTAVGPNGVDRSEVGHVLLGDSQEPEDDLQRRGGGVRKQRPPLRKV